VKALTVLPGRPGSAALSDLPEPDPRQGAVLVEALALGVCGTDLEIVRGEYGWAPPGEERLVLGHESLGRVLEAPEGCGLAPGDLVVGIVRRPDPVPCSCCAVGSWDMCRNGEYTERGIKALHGYGAQRWRIEPEFAVGVDAPLERVAVLLEPASILAKAWERIDRIIAGGCGSPSTALITGAGPIGLLAALLAVQRGLDTHVLDLVEEGAKPRLVDELGATYHTTSIAQTNVSPDVIVECTGVGRLVFDAMAATAPGGVVCLTGVSSSGRRLEVDAGRLNRELVLENDVVFGSVNANRRHYELAADALGRADPEWLEGMISRRVPLEDWAAALERRPDDIKVVLDFAGTTPASDHQ
jgi:threonine dehydrogenase-like Zn-dependent dehydrogenase